MIRRAKMDKKIWIVFGEYYTSLWYGVKNELKKMV